MIVIVDGNRGTKGQQYNNKDFSDLKLLNFSMEQPFERTLVNSMFKPCVYSTAVKTNKYKTSRLQLPGETDVSVGF